MVDRKMRYENHIGVKDLPFSEIYYGPFFATVSSLQEEGYSFYREINDYNDSVIYKIRNMRTEELLGHLYVVRMTKKEHLDMLGHYMAKGTVEARLVLERNQKFKVKFYTDYDGQIAKLKEKKPEPVVIPMFASKSSERSGIAG